MNTTLSRIAIAAVAGLLVTAVAAPVNAACPGSHFINSNGAFQVISNPNWCGTGVGGCYDANGGPPLSPAVRGVFWGVGGADFGGPGGNDSGTFTGGLLPTDFWIQSEGDVYPTAGLYWWGAYITQKNPDTNGPGGPLTWSAAIVDGCGSNLEGDCTCVALSDTWNGQGYFAVLNGPADSQFNTTMNFGQPVHLAPVPSARITNSARDTVSGDVTLSVGLSGDGHPDSAAEGVYSTPGCPPCLAGYRVFGAVVPRGGTPTAGQFLELPLATGGAQGTNTFGSQVAVRADCTPGTEQDLYLSVQVVGEGAGPNPFKANFLSAKSTRVPCGSNLATPGRGEDPRPDRGRDHR